MVKRNCKGEIVEEDILEEVENNWRKNTKKMLKYIIMLLTKSNNLKNFMIMKLKRPDKNSRSLSFRSRQSFSVQFFRISWQIKILSLKPLS